MNRCPSCRSLVPAAWIACRRCGAALSAARPPTAVPRAGTITLERPVVARSRAAAPPHLQPARDTLLPRTERGDSLLPLAPRANARQLPVSRPVALTIAAAAAALAFVVLIVARAPSGASNGGVARNDPPARTLLLQVTDAAQASFVEHGSFTGVTPAALGRIAPGVHVVSATTGARAGQVSVQVLDAATFIAATPAHDGCVFVRVQPGKSRIGYATAAGHSCRAAVAPSQGWRGA